VARRFKLPRLGDICRRIQLAITTQSLDSVNTAEEVRSLQVHMLNVSASRASPHTMTMGNP